MKSSNHSVLDIQRDKNMLKLQLSRDVYEIIDILDGDDNKTKRRIIPIDILRSYLEVSDRSWEIYTDSSDDENFEYVDDPSRIALNVRAHIHPNADAIWLDNKIDLHELRLRY